MKTITLALWLAASAYGVALASESRHAVIVDMPKVMNLTRLARHLAYSPTSSVKGCAYNHSGIIVRTSWSR